MLQDEKRFSWMTLPLEINLILSFVYNVKFRIHIGRINRAVRFHRIFVQFPIQIINVLLRIKRFPLAPRACRGPMLRIHVTRRVSLPRFRHFGLLQAQTVFARDTFPLIPLFRFPPFRIRIFLYFYQEYRRWFVTRCNSSQWYRDTRRFARCNRVHGCLVWLHPFQGARSFFDHVFDVHDHCFRFRIVHYVFDYVLWSLRID